ncbi:MAG: hypothetical protein AAF597_21200 [Bacteroidota bacterium]
MWGRFKIPVSVIAALQLIANYLYRIGGAPILIQRDTLKEDDIQRFFEGAVCLRFFNRGQVPAIIDDTIILYPGESYTEGDTTGPGISHNYNIRFLVDPTKAPLGPDANRPFVYPGNHLEVRIFKRDL